MNSSQSITKKHMVFSSSKELFACPLFHVKEVVGLPKLTLIPTAPKALKGLINLRGKVLPVFDFSEKAGCKGANDESKKPCILIAELNQSVFGLLVDEVIEVLSVHEEQIDRRKMSESESNKSFEGVLKIPDRPLILLVSFEGLFSGESIPSYSNETELNKAS